MDTYDLPPTNRGNRQAFFGVSPYNETTSWRIWQKPVGCQMAFILALSGGGGGGGGCGGIAGSARGGGGGGGATSISRYLYQLRDLPDTLCVLAGAGGHGGEGGVSGNGNDGGNGMRSYVSLYPATTVQNLVAVSGSSDPIRGRGGTTSAGGVAGTGGLAAAIDDATLSFFSISQFTAGFSSGGSGGSPLGSGLGLTWSTANRIGSGGGGGGVTTTAYFGGAYSALNNTPFLATPLGPAQGSPGSNSFIFGKIPMIYGGSGGTASNSNGGGDGGGGGILTPGSGGGGGAGGNPGGNGGNGGPGLIVITCW